MKKITLLLALLVASISFGQVVINEIDCDQVFVDPDNDLDEFIELKSDTPNFSLDGYIVVLFNGSSDNSYAAYDLAGFSTDAEGFFILGSDNVPNIDISTGDGNDIQNGTDAVAIYQTSIANFPEGTPATTTDIIDALVYETGDADDPDLQAALGVTTQYDENANGMKDTESVQRRDDGTYCTAAPTLRAESGCSACTLTFSFGSAECDDTTTGIDTVTYTIDFTGGGNEAVTLASDVSGTIGGDDPSTMATGSITVVTDEDTDSVLTATGATCDVSIDLFGEVCEPSMDVATIAELRAGTIDAEFTLTGEAVLTYQQDFRNQKFIEDATAAILIDDSPGTITSTYNVGDGITGIRGTLSEFNGMLQFVPAEDPGAASSTGNAILAQDVTADQLNANPNDYESEYVRILSATLDNSVLTTFENGEEYAMTTSDGNYTFRTSFFDVDYIGTDVPTSAANVSGIITERNNGDYFITARDAADIDTNLSIENNTIVGLSVYPNPAQNFVNITSNTNGTKDVVIFDITGKRVIETSTANAIDVSNLTSGLYIVEIKEGTGVATAKLIIK